MWKFVRVSSRDAEGVGSYLKEGYEPFAVSIDGFNQEIIWLKKEVADAILNERKSDKRASRATPKSSKG